MTISDIRTNTIPEQPENPPDPSAPAGAAPDPTRLALGALLTQIANEQQQAAAEVQARLTEPLAVTRARNLETIAMLEAWIAEDATLDPVAGATSWAEFRRAMNAHRAGEEPLYP